MGNAGNAGREASDAGALTPTLFLLCNHALAQDEVWLGLKLGQLGFLGDGDDGRQSRFPIALRHAGTDFTIDAGPAALALLQRLTADGQTSTTALAAPPDLADMTVLAITIAAPSPSRRAQVLQRLAYIAAALADVAGGAALYWPPARLWSSAEELAGAVIAMEQQGLPPALHFVGFTRAVEPDGQHHRVQTRGLAWVTGQELAVIGPLSLNHTELLRRAARMVVDAMVHGRYVAGLRIDGLLPGEVLQTSVADENASPVVVEARILPAGR